MKSKTSIYVRCARDVAEHSEPTVQDQLTSIMAHMHRQELGRRIKAGIARKKERELKGLTTTKVLKVRTVRRLSRN